MTESKIVYSTNGIWTGDTMTISSKEPIPYGYTEIAPPQPNYAVKWDGEKWVETATEDEIAHWFDGGELPIDEPSKLEQLKTDNATMQSALMELSDYVFSLGSDA